MFYHWRYWNWRYFAVLGERFAKLEFFSLVGIIGPASPAFSVDTLRPLAVHKALDVMEQTNYRLDQRSLAYFALWVLGEYADESTKGGTTSMMVVLSRCLAMNQGNKVVVLNCHSKTKKRLTIGAWNYVDPLVVAWTLTALTKMVLRIASPVPEEIAHLVRSTALGRTSYDAASYPTSLVMDAQQVGSDSFLSTSFPRDSTLLTNSPDLFRLVVESTRVPACRRDGVKRLRTPNKRDPGLEDRGSMGPPILGHHSTQSWSAWLRNGELSLFWGGDFDVPQTRRTHFCTFTTLDTSTLPHPTLPSKETDNT